MPFSAKRTDRLQASEQDILVPRSHKFQVELSLSIGQRSPPSVRTTSNRRTSIRRAQSRRIPEWLVAFRFGHRQLIHILLHCRQTSQRDVIWRWRRKSITHAFAWPIPFIQASVVRITDPSMARFKNSQSSLSEGATGKVNTFVRSLGNGHLPITLNSFNPGTGVNQRVY
jgi:hypothetical protein